MSQPRVYISRTMLLMAPEIKGQVSSSETQECLKKQPWSRTGKESGQPANQEAEAIRNGSIDKWSLDKIVK